MSGYQFGKIVDSRAFSAFTVWCLAHPSMYPLVLIAGVVAEYVPNELCTADRYVTVFNIIAFAAWST